MKKYFTIAFTLLLLLLTTSTYAQWYYIDEIESVIDSKFINYETWLNEQGFTPIKQKDEISLRKAESMGLIYHRVFSTRIYRSPRQPIKIRCFTDQNDFFKSVDIFLTNPKQSEFDNAKSILIKNGWKLFDESRNENDKTTRIQFEKNNIRLNLIIPDDKSYLTISASTLSSYD